MADLIIPIIAFTTLLFAALTTRILIGFLRKRGIIDIPNKRSSHNVPTPRGGGLAIILAFLLASLAMLYFKPIEDLPGISFWIGLVLVAITSLIDDRLDLPVYMRFSLHLAAATFVSLATGGFQKFPLPEPYNFELGIFNHPLTIFWILAVLNIYNFLDGIDGYAAVQGLVACIGIALLNPLGMGFDLSIFLAAAIAGFLIYNWHPAKIFMGDIGSASLGFIFASLPLYFTHVQVNIGVFSMGIFLWFFLADGAFTIIRRILKGEKIWVAHRSHVYQRLVIKGYSHSTVTFSIMLTGLILVLVHVMLYHFFPDYILISVGLGILFFLLLILFNNSKKV
jgi:Fuc2NAc and GlcNAc transferase